MSNQTKYKNINRFLDEMADSLDTNKKLVGGILDDADAFGEKIQKFFKSEMETASSEAKRRYDELQKQIENPDNKKDYKVRLSDAYNNEMLRIGHNSGGFAEFDEYSYGGENLYNWMLSTSLYMTSWVFRNIIDQQASDIVTHGFKINYKSDTKKITSITREDNQLKSLKREEPWVSASDVSEIYDIYDEMTPELTNLVAWGKMFGGAAALVLDSGLQPNQYHRPLSETGFLGEPRLFVADRWNKMSVSSDNVSNVADPDFGTPVFYNFHLPNGEVCVAHHSRVIRYSNKKGPAIIEQMLQGWGIPELQHLFQELNRNEKIKNTITSLLSKWNLEILKIQGMRQFMQGSLTEAAAQQLDAKLEMINRYRHFNSLIFLDAKDEYIREDGSSMTGLAEILKAQKSEVCGAAKMPMVLLYGDQEKGLSGNPADDMYLYDNRIQAEKNGEYRKAVRKLIDILAYKFNFHKSFRFKIEFNSIIEPTFKDKLATSSTLLSLYTSLESAGLYDKAMIARELKSFGDKVVFGQELTDEKISEIADKVANTVATNDQPEQVPMLPGGDLPELGLTPELPQELAPEMAPAPADIAAEASGEDFGGDTFDDLDTGGPDVF